MSPLRLHAGGFQEGWASRLFGVLCDFWEGLEGLLKTMHKGTQHVGKVPHDLQQSRDLSDKLKALLKKLDKAVAEEDFEEAAVVRDEIKATKEKLSEITAA